MEEIIKECKDNDDHFLCHKGTIVDEKVVCRGWYETYTSQAIRIAGRLKLINFIDPEKI